VTQQNTAVERERRTRKPYMRRDDKLVLITFLADWSPRSRGASRPAAAMIEHKKDLYHVLVRLCGGEPELHELVAVVDGPPQKPNAAHANTIIRR
jgi:hypothetical protein